MSAFGKKEALAFGWRTFRSRWLFFVGLTLIVFVANAAPGAVTSLLPQDQTLAIILISLLGWILMTVVSIGSMKVMLRTVDGEAPKLLDVFNGYHYFFKFILTSILVGVIVFAGILLLVVPGIIFGLRLQFALYAVVDRGLGPIAAVGESWAATRGSLVNIFLLDLLVALVTLAGILVLGVGLLVAMPVTALSLALVWRKLSPAKPL